MVNLSVIRYIQSHRDYEVGDPTVLRKFNAHLPMDC